MIIRWKNVNLDHIRGEYHANGVTTVFEFRKSEKGPWLTFQNERLCKETFPNPCKAEQYIEDRLEAKIIELTRLNIPARQYTYVPVKAA